MLKSQRPNAASRTRKLRLFFAAALLVLAAAAWFFRDLLGTSWTLASLNANWHDGSRDFILSAAHDGFDVTFANYSRDQLSAAPYDDVVPPVLHHIALGRHGDNWRGEWKETVRSCVDLHPGWEAHMWTDDKAAALVADKFPHLKPTWDGYRYPVERVDALRYMVLYEYGGVILDMDLECKRGLGPLRRFEFVAPEAHPTGFSIGFMMAARRSGFVGSIVGNLTAYDRQWLGLPYPTVMFSTGCHFASVIHAREGDRSALKILPAPLHSLNGRVSTPIFEHLGSSSWHSYDARLINCLGRSRNLLLLLAILVVALGLFWRRRTILRRL